ncbi:putative oligomerization/nucleic acid binding protein [Halohasta litchfieldiae]|jgi:hypothetical protein|uniref:Short C-terminal domain-containing protein n=1 Tax=Halohasta litchfieldiae TaxID=1073996 RepID=A0A1H6XDP7_9EURY|nr:SHOCT domain-containing protein [Halohasta litchfieldiae]ATW88127.1 putative oligomerization/nucleic acid binding protein [Halohasta litchfieldiae]SEJ22972.1 Short C-terminal domain-containing protein [Halohasta litchfieldiae]
MSLESHIEAGGRRVLQSPLWTGIAITLFFVLPTVVIPGIPLWVSAAVLLTFGPPIVMACYVLYGIYGRLFGSDKKESEPVEPVEETPPGVDTPLDRLKYRYASGEIDERTFERRLEQLMETEEVARRLNSRQQVDDEITVYNR